MINEKKITFVNSPDPESSFDHLNPSLSMTWKKFGFLFVSDDDDTYHHKENIKKINFFITRSEFE